MARKLEPKYKKQDLIKQVVEMFSQGHSQYEILNWLRDEGEIQISYSYEIIREAKPLVIETLKDIAKNRLETTINEMERMKTEAKLQGDRKLAHDIQKEINKVSGLYQERVDITSDGKAIDTSIKVVFIDGNKSDTSPQKDA